MQMLHHVQFGEIYKNNQMTMKTIAIIPARMASTRFPGKPLADILGLPMIEHVRRRVDLCPEIDKTIVATCDEDIFNLIKDCGGEVVMTSAIHERCTDRVTEAMQSLDADIVINVQGDEPLVNPAMFLPLIRPLMEDPELSCVNLMTEIDTDVEFCNLDVVKTVIDPQSNALYFSREPIPSRHKADAPNYIRYKQLGIIAFRKDFLNRFTELLPTPLEEIESVDMLRAIENGYTVRMVLSPFKVVGVDTPADLEQAISLMRQDSLFGQY
jgi:3-deoxy-manno-octulosonate cytidylyltransferase (CMP-KDO synthetase)